jgi:hypothetical protein
LKIVVQCANTEAWNIVDIRTYLLAFIAGMKSKTKNTVTYWKKKCWDLFSQVIRYRDCNGGVYGNCVTCGQKKHFSELQAGHFIPGRHNSILFDFRGCHAQCYHCNVGLKGNPIKYYKFMLETYGYEVIDQLEILDAEPKQFKVFQLKEIYDQLLTIKKSLGGE